jgi:formiminotetrahydrofolate cyclodeaminase
MPPVSSTTFWASLGFAATAIGGLFTMQLSHAGENGHSSMVGQAEVSAVKINIERISTEVNHNRELLSELKVEIRDMRNKQEEVSAEILEAIRGN